MTALTVRSHMRQESPRTVKHAHQVDIEHPFPAIERNIVDAAARRDAGVVADDVNLLECIISFIGRTIDA